MSDASIAIVGAARTPIGAFGGAFQTVNAVTLGTVAATAAVERAGLGPEAVEECTLGNVLQAGNGMNPARQVALKMGMPVSAPGWTVNQVCGSGLKAVALAADSVARGERQIVVAGGSENMSMAPYLLPNQRWGQRLGHGEAVDSILQSGLWDAQHDYHMGITAENLADRYNIDREAQDCYAAESQQRYGAAANAGRFVDEIVPVSVPGRRGKVTVVDSDEHPRPETTAESLARLKPAFKKDGTVTAGNASGINDGAAAVVLMSSTEAKDRGCPVLATIRATTVVGCEPEIMGIGPAHAINKLLAETGLTLSQIDLIEVNEAFAAQALAVRQELNWDDDRVNVNGGAIALGHPIGASGCRVLVTLLFELQRRQGRFGIAALCIGGGMGIAMLVERA